MSSLTTTPAGDNGARLSPAVTMERLAFQYRSQKWGHELAHLRWDEERRRRLTRARGDAVSRRRRIVGRRVPWASGPCAPTRGSVAVLLVRLGSVLIRNLVARWSTAPCDEAPAEYASARIRSGIVILPCYDCGAARERAASASCR
jgi:hypothetical protein